MTSRSDESQYPSPTYAWYVAVILTVGYIFAFMDRIIIGMLAPAITADLKLTDTQAGLLQGLAFALFYTLFGLPLGLLADRGNRKRILAIGMTVWSAMTSLCGLAGSFWPLFMARIGVGIGEATLNPCSTSLLGDYFPARTRTKAFGLFVSATAIGTVLSFTGGGLLYNWLASRPPLELPFFGPLKPWQATFFIVGLPGLIPAVLLMLTVREPKRIGSVALAPPASAANLSAFLRANAATLICHHVGISLVLVSVYAYVAWLPTLFQRTYGWAPADFSIKYGIPGGVLGVLGAVSAGLLAAWLKSRGDTIGTMRACAIGCTLSAIGSIVTPIMPNGEWAFVAYLITGGFNNYTSTLGLAAIAEIAPNEMRARVTAIYVVCTGLISSTLGPLLVGVISDRMAGDPSGVATGLVVVSAFLALPGALLIAFGWKPYRASLERAAAYS
jgi:MFS family permease